MKHFRACLCVLLITYGPTGLSATSVSDVPVSPELRESFSIYGEPELIKITDRVYLAFAFDWVNCLFVIGDDGVIVIDTLFRVENAERALAQLRKITDKPIVAVIYSHGHPDHTGGVRAFVPEETESEVSIYASSAWPRYRRELASPLYPMMIRRPLEQYGYPLIPPGTERFEHVLGPINPSARTGSYISPNHNVSEATRVTLAGVEMELVPIPSELDDELLVWIPGEDVAYAADTMAHVFPWLSSPRNEPYRSPRGLVRAKHIMLDWQAEHLVLGHGPAFHGADTVQKSLTIHRDAEQTLIDQTIAAVNMGKTRDEAAELIQLPPHLANEPILNDTYHRASVTIKGLYTRYSGWYGDEALEMIQHSPREEAKRMILLAGGADQLLEKAQTALKDGDYPWAAQLATYLILVNQQDDAAKRVKIEAFKSIAMHTHTISERNYLLSGVLSLERGKVMMPPFWYAHQSEMVPTSEFIEFLGPRLDLERSAERILKVNLAISDTGENFRLTVRRGVLARRQGQHEEPDLTLEMDRANLIAFAAKLVSSEELLRENRIKSTGDADQFLGLFN